MSRSLLPKEPVLQRVQIGLRPEPSDATIGTIVLLGKDAPASVRDAFVSQAPAWQQQQWRNGKPTRASFELGTQLGPVWLLECEKATAQQTHTAAVTKSRYAVARDLLGTFLERGHGYQLGHLHVDLSHASTDEQRGALMGLELGFYHFRAEQTPPSSTAPASISIAGCHESLLGQCKRLGFATNIARHLVNLPAADLNPESYATLIAELFADQPHTQVEVWDHQRLASEKMGLILGVGNGARAKPRLVHIRYRHPQAKGQKPVALIGKGVTFDSGGLDIKPADGMRLMKKDMGGSAAVVGAMHWLTNESLPLACDAYLCLAENSVDQDAFRPGDILRSRNGISVEITNTDAEGRLVMADALDLAATKTGADEAQCIIDVATLTGAIKVGLGTDLAGLFSNNDALAEELLSAAHTAGDRVWRMPVFNEYADSLSSTVADLANAASGGFGGAITAALFLQRFIGGKPWAHLDIYAWVDRPKLGCTEAGANGQGVQLLAEFFMKRTKPI